MTGEYDIKKMEAGSIYKKYIPEYDRIMRSNDTAFVTLVDYEYQSHRLVPFLTMDKTEVVQDEPKPKQKALNIQTHFNSKPIPKPAVKEVKEKPLEKNNIPKPIKEKGRKIVKEPKKAKIVAPKLDSVKVRRTKQYHNLVNAGIMDMYYDCVSCTEIGIRLGISDASVRDFVDTHCQYEKVRELNQLEISNIFSEFKKTKSVRSIAIKLKLNYNRVKDAMESEMATWAKLPLSDILEIKRMIYYNSALSNIVKEMPNRDVMEVTKAYWRFKDNVVSKAQTINIRQTYRILKDVQATALKCGVTPEIVKNELIRKPLQQFNFDDY